MSEEKRMLGNYEVTQSIYVGDKEVVLAVDKKEQYPFLVCYCDYHNPLSAAWATEGVASDDYLEAMEEALNEGSQLKEAGNSSGQGIPVGQLPIGLLANRRKPGISVFHYKRKTRNSRIF